MLTPTKKAAGGFKTTTATALHNAADFIAAGARQASAGTVFTACPSQRTDRLKYRAAKGCATFLSTPAMGPVRKNIVIDSGAFTHALSWVFSRPEHSVFGRDGLVRKVGRMAESMFLTSRPPDARKNADGGFQSHSGAEAMTTVNTHPTPAPGTASHLARQQAIENALTTALYFIRLPSTESGLKAATGRAIRAASMLKQACAEIQNGGAL